MKCIINKQHLSISEIENIFSDTVDYLTAEFTFSDDWVDCSKVALFRCGSAVYKIDIEDDAITADKHLNLTAGVWKLSVVGMSDTQRITTNDVMLIVGKSGYHADAESFPIMPISKYSIQVTDSVFKLLYGDIVLASISLSGLIPGVSPEEVQGYVNKYMEEHKEDFVGAGIDEEDIKAIIKAYIEEHKEDFECATDEEAVKTIIGAYIEEHKEDFECATDEEAVKTIIGAYIEEHKEDFECATDEEAVKDIVGTYIEEHKSDFTQSDDDINTLIGNYLTAHKSEFTQSEEDIKAILDKYLIDGEEVLY